MTKLLVLFRILPVICLAVIQCSSPTIEEKISISVRAIDCPAGMSTGEPNFATSASGRVLLSWVETIDSSSSLKLSSRDDSGWSEVKTVASGTDWFVNWADFPAIAVNEGGAILSSWLQKSSGGTYSYDVYLSVSTDGGDKWGEPFIPHDDSTPTEHGFVSMEPLADGSFGIAWLDGRNTTESHGTGEAGGAMTVRFATISAEGEINDPVLLDDRACDCCQTAMTIAGDGSIVVAYRDRSDQEIRDISIVWRGREGWSEPLSVSDDNWRIEGCPVNGPALASADSLVVVSWFTKGNNDTARVLCSFSHDYGKSFSDPLQLDSGDPLGRVDVVFTDAETALISWLENSGDTSRVVVRAVRPGGKMSPVEAVAESSTSRASGFARMATTNKGVWIAWTSLGEKSRVKTALITVR